MKKVIYKYPLKITGVQTVKLPKGAIILTVQGQFDNTELWALVSPLMEEVEDRVIRIIATGEPFEYDLKTKYIATFQLNGGNYVFHVFEHLKL